MFLHLPPTKGTLIIINVAFSCIGTSKCSTAPSKGIQITFIKYCGGKGTLLDMAKGIKNTQVFFLKMEHDPSMIFKSVCIIHMQ